MRKMRYRVRKVLALATWSVSGRADLRVPPYNPYGTWPLAKRGWIKGRC